MQIVRVLLGCVIAYVIGSFSFSIVLSKFFFGGDVREGGSGNAGATNMGRRFGKTAGFLTLAMDALKTVLAMVIGNALAGDLGIVTAGFCCQLGHCFPAFYHFKGGKGVAVGLALAFAAGWQVGVSVLMAFAVTVAISRKVSLASLAAAAAGMLTVWFVNPDRRYCWMVMAAAAVIFLRHSANIERLTQGKEADFHFADEKKNREEKP